MKKKIYISFIYLFLTISAIISVFPFCWMVAGSTNKSVDVNKGKLNVWKSISRESL